MTDKYRLNIRRVTVTLIRNPHVRWGWRLHRGHGDVGVPGLGVVAYLRRTNTHKWGLERVSRHLS